MAPMSEKPTMKERILETADKLFYSRGIRAVGVDTIAAEIGISKRTLYNHFPSKDALISAYLEGRFVQPRAVRQATDRANPRHLRFAGAAVCQQRIFAAAPLSMRSPNSAPKTASVKKIAIAFKESRRALVSRSADRSSASPMRTRSRRSSRCWSTARSRRISCATIPQWRARRRKPRRCCCGMRA